SAGRVDNPSLRNSPATGKQLLYQLRADDDRERVLVLLHIGLHLVGIVVNTESKHLNVARSLQPLVETLQLRMLVAAGNATSGPYIDEGYLVTKIHRAPGSP